MNRYVQPLRLMVQSGFLLFTLYLGVSFYRFVLHLRSGGAAPFVPRPDGIEAFLPISALLSLKGWIISGSVNAIHPAALVILLTAVAVSLLLKRSFCSWVCPVGTVSEIFWKTGFRFLRRNLHLPRPLDIALRGIKYLLLAFFIGTVFWLMPAEEVTRFIHSDYNKLADIRLLDFFLTLSGTALLVILILLVLSLPFQSPFCRFLCPYGALLGLFSSLSPVKVTRITPRCVSCGVCSRVCPASLPVMATERIVSPECVGCWRCISHCRAGEALEMRLTGGKMAVSGLLFALLVVLFFWGGTVIGKVTGNWHTSIPLAEYRRLIGR